MKQRLAIFLLIVSALARASASPEQSSLALATQGTVYFFFNGYEHASGMFLVLPSTAILVNDRIVANIKQKTYFGVKLPAGRHRFATKMRGTDPKNSVVELDVAAGQAAFFRIDVSITRMGWVGYSAYLRLVDQDEGRVMVAALRPVEPNSIKDAARVTTEPPPPLPAGAKGDGAEAPMPSTPIPEEQGIYVLSGGSARRMAPELAGFKTTSVHGLTATLKSQRSAVRLKLPIEFVIRSSASTTAEEYMLLQFFIRSDRREFRTLEGGKSSMSQGPDRMAVPFTAHRMGPSLYHVKLIALPKGEFGFVPPGGALTGPATLNTAVFTFGVD